jgi:signal transduction histidine kinase/AmiR/NasT family two-component response regulator
MEKNSIAEKNLHIANARIQKLEAELRENEQAFRELLSYSEVSYFVYYPQLHRYEAPFMPESIKEVPTSMDNYPETFMKYTELSSEDRRLYGEMVQKIDAGAPEADCTVRMKYQGVYYWFHVHMQNRLDDHGKPLKALGYAVLVEQLKAAEKMLTEERLRMQSLASGILASSCFNVTKDRNVSINNNQYLHYNHKISSAIQQDALQAEPAVKEQQQETKDILLAAADQVPDPEQRRQFIEKFSHAGMLKRYMAGEREINLEYRRYTGKGLIWVHTRVAMLPDPESGDALAFFYTRDIDEEKTLREVMSSLITFGFDNAAYADLQTKKVRLIKTRTDVLAPPVEECLFQDIVNVYVPHYIYQEDQERCRYEFTLKNVLKQLEKAPTYSIYFRLNDNRLPKEKPYKYMRMLFFYLNAEKRYLVLCRSDITEQIEKEQQQQLKLEQSMRQAEAANIAKTNFLARMSHDIRTPLNGIMGMTSLALDEKLPTAAREYLQKIDESSHFLLMLINDILDMSKVESGKLELHPEHYRHQELNSYLDAVIVPLCQAKNINFKVQYPHTSYALFLDKLRFNQILFNLLSNAVKFTPKGGHVSLVFDTYEVTPTSLKLDVTVKDDGIGIDKAFQKKLFDPFEQESTSNNSMRTGSGLGLSIVKSLVELMDGTITVHSSKGHGSEFKIHHLPCTIVPAVAETVSKKSSPVSLQGKQFLLAEDNAINAEIMTRLLEKKGAKVTVATDGLIVVKQYADSEQYTYDAILMDVQMPNQDGLAATQAIRQLNRPDAQSIPIIALTANAYDEDIRTCLKAGMNAHLAKPIASDLLYETLKHWLSNTATKKIKAL